MAKLWDMLQKAEAQSPRPKQTAPKIAPRKLESISAPSLDQIAKPSADSAPVDFKRKKGRPLVKDKASTLSALRPWEAEGISRRLWFYRQAKSKRPGQ